MFDTFPFWAGIALIAAVSQLLPEGAARLRAWLIVLASVTVIGFVLTLTPTNWGVLAGGLTWYCVALPRIKGRRRFAFSLVACAPLALLWTIGKGLTMAGNAEGQLLLFAGLSFLLIKAFSLAKDVCDGRMEPPRAEFVLAYLLFFPTFLAGPMHLYGEFGPQLQSTSRTQREFVPIAFRFVLGLLKVRVLANLLKPISLLAYVDGKQDSAMHLLMASLVYSLVILFDFSGYSDMAIATAQIAGISTPENFRWPYLSANIREFWQRWHVTFSRVLTGYLFVPLTRALQKRLGKNRTVLAAVGYGVTFLFCGFWHGTGINFLVWGLYHAAGLVVYDVYLRSRPPRLPAVAAAPRSGTVVLAARGAGMLVTFLFVSVGWIFFVLPLERVMQVLR